jgi:DNA-binding transcriptional MerR regulator
MLRHYDALGLVTPVRIDERTGYRWYTASQIGRVNALVALKELGFTLGQGGQVLDEQMSVAELIDVLRARQAELARAIEADTQWLASVELRLRSIVRGLTMTNRTLELEALPALRLAQVSAEVNDTTEISAVVGPLFDTLAQRLTAAGLPVEGRGIRTYFGRPDAWQTFVVATDEQGLTPFGVHRQVYLHAPDASDEWVVELQCPVRPEQPGPSRCERRPVTATRSGITSRRARPRTSGTMPRASRPSAAATPSTGRSGGCRGLARGGATPGG